MLHNIQTWSRFNVRRTTINWDVDYFTRFDGHNPNTDPGLGVFQKCCGKFDVKIVGVDIVTVKKTLLHPLQKRYHIESGYDEDFVVCPTLKSIVSGKIPLPFRVNHSQFRPTHKLIWVAHSLDYPHSHWVLKGIDEIDPQEISFDYNYGSVK
jgi:hypothetical protein